MDNIDVANFTSLPKCNFLNLIILIVFSLFIFFPSSDSFSFSIIGPFWCKWPWFTNWMSRTRSLTCDIWISVPGKVFRPQQCHLTDSRFAQLMMVRCIGINDWWMKMNKIETCVVCKSYKNSVRCIMELLDLELIKQTCVELTLTKWAHIWFSWDKLKQKVSFYLLEVEGIACLAFPGVQ